MKTFTLESFAAHLAGMVVEVDAHSERSLERASRLIERAAKQEIGTYQDGAGPFGDWAELAESTKDQRVALGYTENDPGLRSGEMRDSIEHTVESPHYAEIGSDNEKLVFFELGTSKQPPRSVLGLAAVNNEDRVVEIIGEGFVTALTGGQVVPGGLKLRGHEDQD